MAIGLPKRFKTLKRLLPKNFKKAFLFLYVFGFILGLVLTLSYAFLPALVTCSSLFAESFCTPTGLFLIIILSLPGYLIAGNILALFPETPLAISLIIVILTSGGFYLLLGKLIDSRRGKKISISLLNKLVIYIALGILLLFFVSLLQAII